MRSLTIAGTIVLVFVALTVAAVDKDAVEAVEANIFQENSLVRISVEDTDGNFGIGTSSTHPRPCETLLYGFGCGSTSSTTNIKVRVDGLVYNLMGLTAICDGEATHVSTSVVGNSIESQYSLPQNITALVRHTPVAFDAETGAILTETLVTNDDGASHDIGVLYEYDTEVADNDSARLAAGGVFYDVETCFDDPAFTFWEAVEDTFPPAAGDLVGRGTLVGGDAVAPDRFGVGQWGDFFNICWDYTCDGQSYSDSAVFYRWDPVTVAAGGGQRRVATYYGVGSIDVTQGDLAISLSHPTSLSCDAGGNLTPNPFDLNAVVTNTTTASCSQVQAELVLPAGLTTTDPLTVDLGSIAAGDSDQAGWSVTASGDPCNADLAMTVNVTSSDCSPNSADSDVYVPCCGTAPTPTPPIPDADPVPTQTPLGVAVLVLALLAGGVLILYRRR